MPVYTADQFAPIIGAKCLIYGAPGAGKTPLLATAPAPIMLACEPGLGSIRKTGMHVWPGFTPNDIEEFFRWHQSSAEARQYGSVCIDSATEMAEIILAPLLTPKKDPRTAYGEMLLHMQKHISYLYFKQGVHVFLSAKQEYVDNKYRPYFPGKALDAWLPGRMDIIARVADYNIPGHQGTHRAINTRGSYDFTARDRFGALAEYEPMDLTAIANKCTA